MYKFKSTFISLSFIFSFVSAEVKHVKSSKEVKEHVDKNNIVVVKAYADWCGFCKSSAPEVEKLSKEFPDIVYLEIEADEAREYFDEHGVTGLPTFHIYKDKNKESTVVGANIPKLKEEIKRIHSGKKEEPKKEEPKKDTATPSKVKEVKSSQEIKDLAKNNRIVVKVYADWCHFCKSSDEEFEKMAKEIDTVLFVKLHADNAKDEFAASGLPTHYLLEKGSTKPDSTVVGANMPMLKAEATKLSKGNIKVGQAGHKKQPSKKEAPKKSDPKKKAAPKKKEPAKKPAAKKQPAKKEAANTRSNQPKPQKKAAPKKTPTKVQSKQRTAKKEKKYVAEQSVGVGCTNESCNACNDCNDESCNLSSTCERCK